MDLAQPAFSQPTSITNPLFPISALTQVVQVGTEGGAQLRHEITLLPWTRTVEWVGQDVETLVSQFVAYRDGRILEVAYDYFAQADDGSVWYFGEQVDNYEDGVVVDHEGTWLAGKDGPPGMIMPARPEVGDVYRPENTPGVVFEEVTVKSVGERVEGPSGPVEESVLVSELLMDGTLEDKVFAPGYGEFRAQVVSEDELVTVSVAAPIDAVAGGLPRELITISQGAVDILDAVPSEDWAGMSADMSDLNQAWSQYRGDDVPSLAGAQLDMALGALEAAVRDQKLDDTLAAAIEVATAALDLQIRHRPSVDVDASRLEMHTRQLLADAAAGDTDFVVGEAATLQTIWYRMSHTVKESDRSQIDAQLADLQVATEAYDVAAAASSAEELLKTWKDLIAAR